MQLADHVLVKLKSSRIQSHIQYISIANRTQVQYILDLSNLRKKADKLINLLKTKIENIKNQEADRKVLLAKASKEEEARKNKKAKVEAARKAAQEKAAKAAEARKAAQEKAVEARKATSEVE